MPESIPSGEEVAENIVQQGELLDDVLAAAASVVISEFMAESDANVRELVTTDIVGPVQGRIATAEAVVPHNPSSPKAKASKSNKYIGSESKTGRGDQDILTLYLNETGKYDLLTKEDEAELAQTIEAGVAAQTKWDNDLEDPELLPYEQIELYQTIKRGETAHKKFVNHNLRLVVSIAKKYQSSEVPLLDRIQDGNIGLIHAVDKFDWRKGFKFSTYATWWVRQAIERGIDNTSRTIRITANAILDMERVLKTQTNMEVDLGRKPTMQELIKETGLTEEKVKEVLNYPVTGSLDEKFGEEDDSTPLSDIIKDTKASEAISSATDRTAMHSDIQKSLEVLSDKERTVLVLRYGLDGGEEQNITEVAKHFGYKDISKVRQIENRAMAKLRHPSNLIRLEELLQP